jgi:ADP-heptose:LPS heptosyltransferase
MIFFNLNTPISENYKQMGRVIGVSNFDKVHHIDILNEQPRVIPEKYIVVNANASDLRLERRWPLDKYASLIDKIQSLTDYKIALIGGRNEREHISELESLIKDNKSIRNLAGESSFYELISLIQHAEIVITNDTGPMHLSFLFQNKTIALFGPCHPGHYGIESSRVAIHYANTYCSPCVHEFEVAPCNGDNVCMKAITVESVLNSYKELINDQVVDYKSLPVMYIDGDSTLGVVSRS